jgi:carboxyl-terminal processing protease
MERNMARWLKSYWIWLVIIGITGTYAPLTSRIKGGQAKQGSLDSLTEIMDLIQKQSIAPPSIDDATNSSISGMLHTLDPYSNYMTEEEFGTVREESGSAYGIGSIICEHTDGILIKSTIQGGPSEKAGIRRGDLIKEIDGKSVVNWTNQTAAQKLSGGKGTSVEVTIQRMGVTEWLRIHVLRGEVPSCTVPHVFMITSTTGLIVIKEFGKTTAEEFKRAIHQLKSQGMESLILDLRKNRGGLLNAAIEVCKQLLGPNALIVTQKGRNVKYAVKDRTSKDSRIDPFPIVVLIDKDSASSSEIVAGSIQDHDRGLIVGQPSWGKGLVQTIYPIGSTRGLSLTTTRYYTPSGRCIQRNYSQCMDNCLLPYRTNEESVQHNEPKFKTDLGRIVYGNVGITPDYIVAIKKPNTFTHKLKHRYDVFLRFAIQENEKHGKKSQQVVNNMMVERFKRWLEEQKIECSEVDWKDPKNQVNIRNEITIAMQDIIYGTEAVFHYQCNQDPQVHKALEIMPKAKALLMQTISTINI